MKQKDERRFVSLKIKWAAGTALGSLIIFCIVAMALFSAFTQNLFHQERQLLGLASNLSNTGSPIPAGRFWTRQTTTPPAESSFCIHSFR